MNPTLPLPLPLPLLLLLACADKGADKDTVSTDSADPTACDPAPAWPDQDGDGFGDDLLGQDLCELPVGWVEQGGDCDDDDPLISPDGTEHCDGRDEDCDGLVDEDTTDGPTWYVDADGDGYGDPASAFVSCEVPADGIATEDDCDDTRDDVFPGAEEICEDEVDQDCDGEDLACTPVEDPEEWDAMWVGQPDERPGDPLALLGDMNGDGRDSFAVVNPGTDGSVYLVGYEGPGVFELSTFPSLSPSSGSAYSNLGQGIWGGEDLDGDGIPDLVLTAYSSGGPSRVYLLRGPVTGGMGLDEAASAWVEDEAPGGLGNSVDGGADLNGDGAPDLLLGEYLWDSGVGAAWILTGSWSGEAAFEETGALRISSNSTSVTWFGETVGRAGDVDGDGFEDLVVTKGIATSAPAFLLLGPVTTDLVAEVSGTALKSSTWGGPDTVAALGDADGDGRDDLLLGSPGSQYDSTSGKGHAFLVCGPTTIGDLDDATAVLQGDHGYYFLGQAVDAPGDADGDGTADLLLSDGEDDGRALLVSGTVRGQVNAGDVTLATWGDSSSSSCFGEALLVVPDADGDGLRDLLVGGDCYGDDEGAAWLFLGLEM